MPRHHRLPLLLCVIATLCWTTCTWAQNASDIDGPVPIGTPEWSARLLMFDDPHFIQEASVNLLSRWLRARGVGVDTRNWARDQRLLTELLFAYDVNAYQRSDANEILRPQLLRAVQARLQAVEPQRRLRLRMHLELGQYDSARGTFELLYPQFFASDPPDWMRGSTTGRGGECVWPRGQKLRPDTGAGFFIVWPLCREEIHRWIAPNAATLLLGEAPSAFVLRVAPGTLWAHLPVPLERASAFVTQHKDSRGVSGELVFDLESFTPLRFGPFSLQDPPPASWAAEARIKPIALFVWEQVGSRTDFAWEQSPHNGWRLLGAVGAVSTDARPDSRVLTHEMVTAPLPPDALASDSPTAVTPVPPATRNAGAAGKAHRIPPPATRQGGAGAPSTKRPTLPPVPVGN